MNHVIFSSKAEPEVNRIEELPALMLGMKTCTDEELNNNIESESPSFVHYFKSHRNYANMYEYYYTHTTPKPK